MDFTQLLTPQNETPNNGVVDSAQAGGTQVEQVAPPAAPQNQEQSTTSQQPNNTQAAPPAAAAQSEPDYNAYLDKMSGGLIKDQDGFKAALPRLTEYEQLKQQKEDFEAKLAKAPVFATDEVRLYNDLVASGASKDQLKNFQKINEVGDLAKLSPLDARIAKMVLVDGIKESTAKVIAEREFKVDEEMDEIERDILDANLLVASKSDIKELARFKAEVTELKTPAPEETLLQKQAQITAHMAKVKPYVADVFKSINSFGTTNLSGKEGAEAVPLDLAINDTDKAQLQGYVENFFSDGTPITKESTVEALTFAKAQWWMNNGEQLIKNAFDKGVSLTTEKITNQYENRSGLRNDVQAPARTGGNTLADTAQFAQDVANRRVRQ